LKKNKIKPTKQNKTIIVFVLRLKDAESVTSQ